MRELVQLQGRVDLVIPRGGEELINAVTEQARVPVIKHSKGEDVPAEILIPTYLYRQEDGQKDPELN